MKFDEKTIRKLTRLTLVAGQVRAGVLKGERRSTKRGSSLEFADYRSYTPGDDLRRIDWNAYARLDRTFLKLFEEEEDLAVHVLVDASRSMDWGSDEYNKFQYALKLAAAVGAIALSSGDRLTVSSLQAEKHGPQFGPASGQLSTLPLLRYLEGQQSSGETDLYKSLREYVLVARRPGLVFLISDLFSQSDALTGLALLQSRGYEVALLHLLAPDEIDPPLAGDLRLIDIETGLGQDVSLDNRTRALYRERLQAWREEIGAACRKRGIRYLGLNTAQPWEQVVLQQMRQADLVR